MKKTITILISLITFNVCKGQNDTALAIGHLDGAFPIGTYKYYGGLATTSTGLTFIKSKTDTIKVQMLVSDKFSNKVVIIKGYVIQNNGWNRIPFEYLDIIKQPLEKSITVWDYKTLK